MLRTDMQTEEIIYVGYGVGDYYAAVHKAVQEKITLSFLCDKKWEGGGVDCYDGIPVISQKELAGMKGVKAVIFASDYTVQTSIAKDLNAMGISYVLADEALQKRVITSEDIRAEGEEGVWRDACGNTVYYDETLPDGIQIAVRGQGGCVRFGTDILTNSLMIQLGNHGTCEIGSKTRLIGVQIYVAYASVQIGADCLFARGVVIRTHDAHYIFDRNTHQRINAPTDVVIGDQVWVCADASLFAGARIGTGSVVGARAVTSRSFEDHVIIAGVPAKVIRRNICWSKDNSCYTNYSSLEECSCQDALKYMGQNLAGGG